MGLQFGGYVLEAPRVGQGNSAYTWTPDNFISDQIAFDAAYPFDQSNPRTEYLVLVVEDGDLVDAKFAWTKNEGLTRFGYKGQQGAFLPLPGASLDEVGVLTPDANTTRLTVVAPAQSNLVTYPVRLSVGPLPGTAFTVVLVPLDTGLNSPNPPVGSVQISQESGSLGWNPADLTSFNGQDVRFQRQSFFEFDKQTSLGFVDGTLFLNPIPATGQLPRVRIGFHLHLTPVEVTSFGTPASGEVEWRRTTGELKFNTSDVAANLGSSVYYDGVLFATGLTVQTSFHGTVASPTPVLPVPPEAADVFFRAVGALSTQFGGLERSDDPVPPAAKRGQVTLSNVTGAIKTSLADIAVYGASQLQMVVPDIEIEHGISIRLSRSPGDPTADNPGVNDVTAFYLTENATLADPIIAAPQVFLPQAPLDDANLEATLFNLQGSRVLPRLDVTPLPPGNTVVGYVLDFEQQQLAYARLRRLVEHDPGQDFTSLALEDVLIQPENLVVELQATPGGFYVTLTEGEDYIIDLLSGVVTLTSASSTRILIGVGATLSGTSLSDPNGNLQDGGVQQGDFLLVRSGSAAGVYVVNAVASDTSATIFEDAAGPYPNVAYEIWRGAETLVDRYWREIPPLDPNTKVERLAAIGTASNSPRLTINVAFANRTRFRFGTDRFSTAVNVVAAFTTPSLLAQGVIEVDETSGALNFSTHDLGEAVFWSLELVLGVDYNLQPGLGFIEFTERFLERGEALLTYAFVEEDDSVTVIEERAAFLVRKELTPSRSSVTDRVTFNDLGRELAVNPPAQVFRGGRPQKSNQVVINYATSEAVFQTDDQVTDALPHGNVLEPDENVYVDYYIHQAIGGEKDVAVTQPPMKGVNVVIEDGATSFLIEGDYTASFPANHLLQIDRSAIYMIGGTVYDGVQTTITLAGGSFRDDYLNPPLSVVSGITALTSTPGNPSYFVAEVAAYETVPRGSNVVRLTGDRTKVYERGVVIHFTGAGAYDFGLVEASVYDVETNRTELKLSGNGYQQYTYGTHQLFRTVRPVLDGPTGQTSTTNAPLLDEPRPTDPVLPSPPVTVIRKASGEVGEILESPADYKIDSSGVVTLNSPLDVGEAVSLLYVGVTPIEAGRKLRATYVHGLVPTESNGLLGATLKLTYRAYLPDTFYWRVEPMDVFRAELQEQYGDTATASLPTAGPVLENAAQPRLYDQGRESLYFPERRLANEDVVARGTLKAYNDAINYVEDALQSMDGRVVGDQDGRLLFDGSLDNPVRLAFADATNQIDDRIQLLPSLPVFPRSAQFVRKAYQSGPDSRFYPSSRYVSAEVGGTGGEVGTPIADLGYEKNTSVGPIQTRLAWAVVTEPASADQTHLVVDNTAGTGLEELLRPVWQTSDRATVLDRSGSYIINGDAPPVGTPLVVTSVPSTTRLNFSGPLGVAIPVGSTIRHGIGDYTSSGGSVQPVSQLLNFTVGWNPELGALTEFSLAVDLFGGSGPPPPADGDKLDVLRLGVPVSTTPDRFPALDGETTDDDGNRRFPILNPDPESEQGGVAGLGHLSRESKLLAGILAHTNNGLTGTGSLDPTGTVLTNVSGNWGGVQPAIGDIIRTTSGVNGQSAYKRIQAVTLNTVTLSNPLIPDPSNFAYHLVRGSTLSTGAFTVSGTTLTAPAATFMSDSIRPGHVIALWSVVTDTRRRQVVRVISDTELELSSTVPWGAGTYRVSNALGSYGLVAGSEPDQLEDALDGQLRVLRDNPTSERNALEEFFDAVFDDVVPTGGSATVTSTSDELTDSTRNFNALGVTSGQYVFIRSGAVAGTYQIQEVLSSTRLRVDRNFPANATGQTYAIRETTLVSLAILQPAHEVLVRVDAAITPVEDARNFFIQTVSVTGDAAAYANVVLDSNLTTRQAEVNARLAEVATDLALLSGGLSTGDRLYDRRYTWIDARINLETGIIVKQERAIANREQAKIEAAKQILKLLTV